MHKATATESADCRHLHSITPEPCWFNAHSRWAAAVLLKWIFTVKEEAAYVTEDPLNRALSLLTTPSQACPCALMHIYVYRCS